MQGLMETFLPFGASELANNNWITRIAGSFAGAGPQLPNMAGKSSSTPPNQRPAPTPMPPPISSGRGIGAAPGPTNINVTYNNNGATEDRAGADLTSHLMGMNQNMAVSWAMRFRTGSRYGDPQRVPAAVDPDRCLTEFRASLSPAARGSGDQLWLQLFAIFA